MRRIEAPRRLLQPFALKRQFAARALPSFRLTHDRGANLRQGAIIRMPDSGSNEASTWFKVEIKHWSVRVLALGMREVDTNMSFERLLVVRETGVAIDAKQGASG